MILRTLRWKLSVAPRTDDQWWGERTVRGGGVAAVQSTDVRSPQAGGGLDAGEGGW